MDSNDQCFVEREGKKKEEKYTFDRDVGQLVHNTSACLF
jgi:hypothetical protein